MAPITTNGKQPGHMLLVAIVLITIFSVMMAMAISPIRTSTQRQKEKELVVSRRTYCRRDSSLLPGERTLSLQPRRVGRRRETLCAQALPRSHDRIRILDLCLSHTRRPRCGQRTQQCHEPVGQRRSQRSQLRKYRRQPTRLEKKHRFRVQDKGSANHRYSIQIGRGRLYGPRRQCHLLGLAVQRPSPAASDLGRLH